MSSDRTPRLLAVPASLTLFCGLILPPRASMPSRLAATIRPAVIPVKRAPKSFPRIAAVSAHIAKRVNDLRPSVKVRLQKALAKLPKGVTILVTSAARTREEQARLHSTFGVKARPGTSCHEDGRAVDLNVLVDGERVPVRRQNRIIGAAMASEGFRYLGPRDPVHYSVPMDEIDPLLSHGPDLDVCSMEQVREIALQAMTAVQPPAPATVENSAIGAGKDSQQAVNN